ncbi:hypothetical protein [Paracoccus pantotrophus]|uniref:hypothetical protein n=1 Tax=Paracoccus pantotrophus TaxID=82367 RepID=UPI00048D64F0|nr:hypothetical protein [Paracoccus pantotrophus]
MSGRPDPIRVAIVKGLLAGLGAEDIAVRGKFRIAAVRSIIDQHRKSGVLASIIQQARAA